MRTLKISILAFISFTAIVSGMILIARPDGSLMKLPLSLLSHSSFESFLIPGIILCAVVGGSSLIALINTSNNKPRENQWCLFAGIILIGWIIIEIVLIRGISWLHWVYLIAGIAIMLLADKGRYNIINYEKEQ